MWPLLAAWSGPQRPNVLFIVIDTLRADRLGSYGNQRELTPFLDAVAAKATVFPTAYAASSWTVPSVMSMFTACLPTRHGVGFGDRLDPSQPVLAEILAHGGYRTGAFVANPLLSAATGFARGFDAFTVLPGTGGGTAESVRAASLAWLDGSAGDQKPVFLYLHYMEPHWTYSPPKVYEERFASSPLSGQARAYFMRKLGRLFRQRSRHEALEAFTCQELESLESLYDAEVAWLDAELGRLLADLDRRHFLDNTIVVITSDHGEEFLDHGYFWHERALYEESVRVPLIIRLPGQGENRIVTRPVSLVDLAPSLLELLGVPPPPALAGHSFAREVSRSSWLPTSVAKLLYGSTASDQPIIAQLDWNDSDRRHRYLHTAMVLQDSTKLLVRSDRTVELYNLAQDPGEQLSLPGPAPALQAVLLADLEAAERNAGHHAASQPRLAIDEAARERIAALGYDFGNDGDGAQQDDELARASSNLPLHYNSRNWNVPLTDLDGRIPAMGVRRAGCLAEADFIRAAREGNFVMVATLADAGADVNGVDEHGVSALVGAAQGGYQDIVRTLLSRGARIRSSGRSALVAAAEHGQLGTVGVLLEQGAEIDAADMTSASALQRAAESNHLDVIHLLLAAGAKVDVRDRKGVTPLIAAAVAGHSDVVKWLLSAGADPRVNSLSGDTPLLDAVSNGDAATVAMLLRHGVPVNATLPDGTTALMNAVDDENTEIVALLLANGADPHLKNEDGETAFDVAEDVGNPRLMRMLREAHLVKGKPSNR